MSVFTYGDFKNLVGSKLVEYGIYDSINRIDFVNGVTSDTPFGERNDFSRQLDLIIIRNKINGCKAPLILIHEKKNHSWNLRFRVEYLEDTDEERPLIRLYLSNNSGSIKCLGVSIPPLKYDNYTSGRFQATFSSCYVDDNFPSTITGKWGFDKNSIVNYYDIGSTERYLFGTFFLNFVPHPDYPPLLLSYLIDGFAFNSYAFGENEGQCFRPTSVPSYFYKNMTDDQVRNTNNYEITYAIRDYDIDESSSGDWAPTMEDFNMELELWSNFSKRKNSTKRPGITGTILNVTLMEPTSIMRPTFIITNVNFTWNYCKFGGRYYFINNITSIDKERIALECQIDVLATWKSNIMGSSAFIKRAAWATGHMLIDSLNPPTDQVIMKTAESGSALGIDNNIYYYIFVSGGDGNSLYKLDKTNFDKLVKALWTGPLTDAQRVNIMSMMVKCFSMQYSLSGTSVTEIKFGPTTCSDLVAERISLTQPSENVNLGYIVIPFVSADWGYNTETYLDHSPYTTGLLYLPGVGVTSLDLDVIGSTRRITVLAYVAKSTGEITYKITTDNGKILSTFSGSLASDIPLSSGGYDPYAKMQATMSLIGGGVAFAAGALSGNALMALGGIGAMGAGTVNQMKAAEIHSMVNGAMSSNIALSIGEGRKAKAITITKVPVNTDLDHNKTMFGLPVESVGSLNNSGYVQTVGANIQMAGTEQEKIEVNGLLDSGIFIE